MTQAPKWPEFQMTQTHKWLKNSSNRKLTQTRKNDPTSKKWAKPKNDPDSKLIKNSAESPRYTLIELKKEPEARDTLVKLRGTDNVSFIKILRNKNYVIILGRQ